MTSVLPASFRPSSSLPTSTSKALAPKMKAVVLTQYGDELALQYITNVNRTQLVLCLCFNPLLPFQFGVSIRCFLSRCPRRQRPKPPCGPLEVRIRVRACCVTPLDVHVRKGLYSDLTQVTARRFRIERWS